MPQMSGHQRIRLKTYRFARNAYLECAGDELALRLPPYFGRRRWRVPMAEVNVIDLTSPQTAAGESDDVYAEPVRTPYLYTTGPLTRPTTLLLFTTPQRVPPVRFFTAIAPNSPLPVGYRKSRSADGAWLDGVFLRAADPGAAAALFFATLAGTRWAVDHGARWLWPVVAVTGTAAIVLMVVARRAGRSARGSRADRPFGGQLRSTGCPGSVGSSPWLFRAE